MSDHPRDESTKPAQKCDVCGKADPDELFVVQRRAWNGETWVTTAFALCCTPLCLFGAAMNPAEHLTPVETE